MNTKGKMGFINVNDTVKDVFELTGFVDILTIEQGIITLKINQQTDIEFKRTIISLLQFYST